MSVDGRPRDYCGVVGVFDSFQAASQVWLGLHHLQHRGQEAAGIAAMDEKRIRLRKGLGLVSQIFPGGDVTGLMGDSAIGHVRYATSGSSGDKAVQPLLVHTSDGMMAAAHNGNIPNAHELRRTMAASGAVFQTDVDSEVAMHLLLEKGKLPDLTTFQEQLCKLDGAYSFVFLLPDRMIAARDPGGYRPLSWGRLEDGGYAVASETCALLAMRAKEIVDVECGQLVEFTADGPRFASIAPAKPSHCLLEHVYFARPDSKMFGCGVHQARINFGAALARSCPADADLVIAVPESGVWSAVGYAKESGLPLDRGIIRSHYVGRSFISPNPDSRYLAAALKQSVIPEIVKGKRLALVDDSLVRGTTMRAVSTMLRDAGCREIHLRIACPPLRHPCIYGVDIPTIDELIATNRTEKDVAEELGLDSLRHLSLEAMLACYPNGGKDFCTSCWTGYGEHDPIVNR